MILGINLGQDTRIDRDVSNALFLHTHTGWKPEDLGYPPSDFILIDLMRLFR